MAWNFLAMTVSGAEARSAKLRNAAAGLAQDPGSQRRVATG